MLKTIHINLSFVENRTRVHFLDSRQPHRNMVFDFETGTIDLTMFPDLNKDGIWVDYGYAKTLADHLFKDLTYEHPYKYLTMFL